MNPSDVVASELVWDVAYRTMRERFGPPIAPRSDEMALMIQRRMHHLLGTDADGCVVATVDDRVVGFAQALVREDLWVLSRFAVEPAIQGRGVGRALLDASMACGEGRRGMILVSRDPLAMRRYFTAGFDLHPTLTALGTVRPDRLPTTPSVRAGDDRDFERVAAVDREVRGASHGPDLAFLIGEGSTLLVHEGGGYALAGRRPLLLAATSDEVATELLAAVLRRVAPGEIAEVGWLTARQQWAIRLAVGAGMELHPVGPMGLRGFDQPPAPYIATGAFG
jgi:GNAT superfamily N-acetyltransferase